MTFPECFQREKEMWIPVMAMALTLAMMRIAGRRSRSFSAIGHLFVGLLFGLGIGLTSVFYSWVGFALTIVELAVHGWNRSHMTPDERKAANQDC